MKLFPYSFILLILSCALNEKKEESSVSQKAVINEVLDRSVSYCYDSIQGIRGVIVNNPDLDLNGNTKLNIYEIDGTISSSIEMNKEYQPIVYKCLDFNEEYFSIMIEGNKKYLKRDDNRIFFQTWENHILDGVFAINFDVKSNPLKKSVGGENLITQISNNHRIIPLEINGDFLRVSYQDFNTSRTIEGWIQWRTNYCLLIELLYFA